MYEIECKKSNTVRTIPETKSDIELLQKAFPHLVITDYGVVVKKENSYPVKIDPRN